MCVHCFCSKCLDRSACPPPALRNARTDHRGNSTRSDLKQVRKSTTLASWEALAFWYVIVHFYFDSCLDGQRCLSHYKKLKCKYLEYVCIYIYIGKNQPLDPWNAPVMGIAKKTASLTDWVRVVSCLSWSVQSPNLSIYDRFFMYVIQGCVLWNLGNSKDPSWSFQMHCWKALDNHVQGVIDITLGKCFQGFKRIQNGLLQSSSTFLSIVFLATHKHHLKNIFL